MSRKQEEIVSKLQRLAFELETSIQILSRNFTHAIHDMRAPIVAIRGYTRMVLEGRAGPINEKQRTFLTTVAENTKTSVETTREMAKEKDLQVIVRLQSQNLWVMGDQTRLEQVVMNLLTNAVKYTSNGGTVTVSSRRVENEAQIQVEDTGIGIAPDFLEQIFQAFRQGSNLWITSESGLGLGLSIARQIVEMHSGRIWALSEGLGSGSTFILRLPLAALPAGAPPPEAATVVPASEPRPVCVLLIEDSADVLYLMKLELEWLGYSVLIARNAETGLEIARRELPDLIVSDIKMPGMDGYEFIKRLRALPELANKPAIALTGFGMKRDVEASIATGFTAHLSKPVNPEDLSALIQKLISQKSDPKK